MPIRKVKGGYKYGKTGKKYKKKIRRYKTNESYTRKSK